MQRAIKEYISKKSIAIIGHAEWLLSMTKGEEIDAHDIVFRLNHGLTAGREKSLGKKTDIWMNGDHQPSLAIHGAMNPEIAIIVNEVGRVRFGLDGTVYEYPRGLHNRIIDAMYAIGGEKPSTGALAIMLMLELGGFDRLSLYGFDWFASRDWTNGYKREKDDPGPHNFYVEEYFILNEILNDKRVAWITPDKAA